MEKLEKYFCNYNQAIALKELGFDKPCLATINQIETIHIKGAKRLPSGATKTPMVL